MLPPVHPPKSSDLDLEYIAPRAGMDELVLVKAIDILGQRIIRGIHNRSRRWGDACLGEALVIHNTDVLAAVITVVEIAAPCLGWERTLALRSCWALKKAVSYSEISLLPRFEKMRFASF